VIVIEHNQVQPAVEHLFVDGDIRLMGSASGPVRLPRRVLGIDRAGLDLLRLAVSEHLEVFRFKRAETTVAVPTHVFFYVVHLDLEGDFGCRRRRGLGRRLRRRERGREHQTGRSREHVVSGFSRTWTGGFQHGSPLYYPL
jgi:hypothetical protein